jgi:adenylate cyclase
MNPQTNEKRRNKDEDKKDQLNGTSESVLNRIKDDNKSSGNVKLKEELIDLETLFTQRQDKLWRALKERYDYDTSVKHSQDFLLKHKL